MKKMLINKIVRFLSLFRPRHPKANRFLIVSTTGLGDSLWGTPAIHSLRASFPKAYISLLTSSIGKQVFENNPNVDEIFVFEKPVLPNLIRLYFLLRKKGISTVFIFHVSQRLVIPLCATIGATEIIGTAGINKNCDDYLTKALPQKRQHEIERRLATVAAGGATQSYPQMQLYPDDYAAEEAKQFLRKENLESYIPIVAIHPGAKDRFKQWPPHCFIALGKRLVDHLGCQLIVSGSKEEAPLVQSIAKHIPNAIPLNGELRIHAFAQLLKKCSLFITKDTGPMHIAFAMDVPTVALFAPTDPQLCGPYFVERATIISKQRTCRPCLVKRCQNPFCMLQISPNSVFEAAMQLFYKGNNS